METTLSTTSTGESLILEDQIRKHSVLLNDSSPDSECGSIQVGISASDKINATDFFKPFVNKLSKKVPGQKLSKSSEKTATSKFWQKLSLTSAWMIQLVSIFFFRIKKKT